MNPTHRDANRHPHPQGGRRARSGSAAAAHSTSGRSDYHLTEKGRRLRVVLVALRQWGEDNLFTEGEPMLVMHDSANRPIARLRLMNQEGRMVEPEEVVVTRGRKKSAREAPAKPRHSQAK